MTIFNTFYINGNSCNSSSGNNFFMTSTNTDKGITYGSDTGVTPYVSPFDSHVKHEIAHPHRPAFGMSMNESIFNCRPHGGHHGGNNNDCGCGGHNTGVHYSKHMPIPLVPVDKKSTNLA